MQSKTTLGEREAEREKKKNNSTVATSDSCTLSQLTKWIVIIGGRDANSNWGDGEADTDSSNKTGLTELLSCLVCGSHKHVFERRAKLGPQLIE